MEINILLSNKKSKKIKLKENDTISLIIDSIRDDELNLPNIRLKYSDKILEPSKKLSEYNIKENSTIYCINELYNKTFTIYRNDEKKQYSITFGQLLEIRNKKELLKNLPYEINNFYDCFSVKDKETKYTIFFSCTPLIVNIRKTESENSMILEKLVNVVSSKEIIDKCKDYNLYEPYIIREGKKIMLTSLSFLFQKIGELDVFGNETSFKDFEDNNSEIITTAIFLPNTLTSYFYNIFKYNKKDGKPFEFFKDSRQRIDLLCKLTQLKDEIGLKLFMFTGPSSIGKSTTLICWSRLNYNILYFHLGYLRELKNKEADAENYNYFVSECQRIQFQDSESKNNFKTFLGKLKRYNYIDIIKNLIDYLNNNITFEICFILDQVKEKNLPSTSQSIIINSIKSSKYNKLIICSSINNSDIQKKVMETLSKYNIQKMELNENTQDYYFYYTTLDIINTSDNKSKFGPLLKFFNFKKKYQYLFESSNDFEKEFTNIKVHIKNKIKEFIDMNSLNLSICDILLYAKKYIGENINCIGNLIIINNIPLKYFILKFGNNGEIYLDYSFPYIKYLVDEIISIEDCDNYFQQQKYKFIDFLKGDIKGYYFEYSCIYYIKKSNFFGENEKVDFQLRNISSFDQIILDEVKNAIEEIKKKSIESKKESEINNESNNESNNKNNLKLIEFNFSTENIERFKFINDIDSKSSIYDYANENINFKSKTIFGYENYNIFLTQNNTKAKCLDLGLLTGKQTEKIFLGMQIKCYSPKTTGGNIFYEDKNQIKEKCKNVIAGAHFLFNCSIKEWHYMLILYYNNDDEETNKYLETLCKKKFFEYIYYDPINHQFRDHNKNIINFYNISNSRLTNLDNNSTDYNNPKDDFYDIVGDYINKKRERAENVYDKYLEDYYSFLKEFDSNFNESTSSNREIKQKMDLYISKIKKNIDLLKKFDLKFKSKYLLSNNRVPHPPKEILYVFRSNNEKLFYAIFDKEKNNTVGYLMDLEFQTVTKIEGNGIYGEVTSNYFYVFDLKQEKEIRFNISKPK